MALAGQNDKHKTLGDGFGFYPFVGELPEKTKIVFEGFLVLGGFMNELMSIKQDARMSSKEIADLTGKHHNHVMRDIKDLIDQEAFNESNFGSVNYIDKKGEKRPMYVLDKEACLILATGYNAPLRAKIIRRWMELEAKEQRQLTKLEILELAIESEKKLIAAQSEIKELKPKADFYDAVAGSKDAIDMGSSAKVLDMGIGRNKLFELLRNKGVLMPNNQPYQKYIDAGYFRTIEQKYNLRNGDVRINIKTLIYQKGLQFIRKMVEAER